MPSHCQSLVKSLVNGHHWVLVPNPGLRRIIVRDVIVKSLGYLLSTRVRISPTSFPGFRDSLLVNWRCTNFCVSYCWHPCQSHTEAGWPARRLHKGIGCAPGRNARGRQNLKLAGNCDAFCPGPERSVVPNGAVDSCYNCCSYYCCHVRTIVYNIF